MYACIGIGPSVVDVVRAAPARTQGKPGVFVQKKYGGTRLCIPKDKNYNFSLAVIFAFS